MNTLKNWKLVGLAVFSGLFGSLFFNLVFFNAREAIAQRASKENKVVTAQAFHLVDSNGKTKSALVTSEDGNPYLAFYDANGKSRLGMTISSDGSPSLTLFDESHKDRVHVAISQDGSPHLAFFDAGGKLRVDMSISSDGSPNLVFFDANSKASWAAGQKETVKDSPKTGTQPQPQPGPVKLYSGMENKHWVKKNNHGENIILEDNSVWEIYGSDKVVATLWPPTTNIRVTESSDCFKPHGYLLLNLDDGEKACAKYMGMTY